jgi:hypothetical protein
MEGIKKVVWLKKFLNEIENIKLGTTIVFYMKMSIASKWLEIIFFMLGQNILKTTRENIIGRN